MTAASRTLHDDDCVIGLDVGGTSTRVLAVDLAGNRIAENRGSGGNPVSRGAHTAVRNVAETLAPVMKIVPAERVRSVVMGIAGIATLKNETGEPLFNPVWRDMGLSTPARLVADAVVAFTAGTPQPSGTVLIAGTGAIATGITEHKLSGRRSDGYGWLLGDLGSGFWLGREAVAATLRHVDGTGPGGGLVDAVVAAMLPAGVAPTVNRIVSEVMSNRPVALSRYAPLVTGAADDGDDLANQIVDTAVEHLVTSVNAIHTDGRLPVVLAGSLAGNDTVISRRLRPRLAAAHPGLEIRTGTDGAAGAAWLAAAEVIDDAALLGRLHTRLLSAASD